MGGDGTNGEDGGCRFDSGRYSGGGSGWLAPRDGGGVKSGCGPGLRFKPLASRSASWLRCQRRVSRASWSSMTQCQRPHRIRRLTRTGPSSAHTAVRPTGSSCCSAWAEGAMAASSSPPTQPARPHSRTVAGGGSLAASCCTLGHLSCSGRGLVSGAVCQGRDRPGSCRPTQSPTLPAVVPSSSPCHRRAISSGHQRYPADSHGQPVRGDDLDSRS
jgi:hypothetical protein